MKFRSTTRATFALLLFAAASQAFAQSTVAGTDITNQATVDYKVGTVDQDQVESNELTFEVDRKVDLVVTKVSDASVAPNATDEVLEFTVQNKTNDTIDVLLSTEDGGGTFAATGTLVWVENDLTAGFSPDDDQVLVLDALAPDDTRTVYIVSDIPGTATNTQTDVFWLSAQARVNDLAAGTTGVAFTESGAADDPAVIDNVFADGDGPAAEADQDGKHSAEATYTVSTAALTVTKSYKVIFEDAANSANFSDPGEEKPVPGALVEFCILVSNGTAIDAKSVTVTDVLGAGGNTVAGNSTWQVDSIKVGTSCDYASGVANDDDAVDEAGDDDATGISASFNSGTGTVTSTVETLSGNTDTATMFRVVLN